MPSFQIKFNVLKNNTTSKLFDTSFCKCNSFKSFCYSRDTYFPQREKNSGSTENRKMIVGGIDQVVSKQNVQMLIQKYQPVHNSSSTLGMDSELIERLSNNEYGHGSADEYNNLPIPFSIKQKYTIFHETKKQMKYRELPSTCDRTGVSDRSMLFLQVELSTI